MFGEFDTFARRWSSVFDATVVAAAWDGRAFDEYRSPRGSHVLHMSTGVADRQTLSHALYIQPCNHIVMVRLYRIRAEGPGTQGPSPLVHAAPHGSDRHTQKKPLLVQSNWRRQSSTSLPTQQLPMVQ